MKEPKKVVITAGFDKSIFAICVAELLRRKNIEIVGIVVVNPFTAKRVINTLQKRGFQFIKEAIPRLLGKNQTANSGFSPISEYQKSNNIEHNSLKKWARSNDVPYQLVPSINHTECEQFLKSKNPNYLIYGGGGIIRDNIIDAVKENILNAHLGPLPEIRGMNAIEWSVLLNERKEITIHYIDHGIDTGKIIKSYPVDIKKRDTVEIIREKAKVSGMKGLIDVVVNDQANKSRLKKNSDEHRQCFVLSNTMKSLLEFKMNNLT